MKLHDLKPTPGSRTKRKRVGRGLGSGRGKTAGKGMMGQKARSGSGPYRTFEGGQNRLVKRMPFKRGFTNIFRTEYQIVNVRELESLRVREITLETLYSARLIRKKQLPVKILGDGVLRKRLIVQAHRFSQSARTKIEAAGGRVVEVPWESERPSRSRGPNPSMRKRGAILGAQTETTPSIGPGLEKTAETQGTGRRWVNTWLAEGSLPLKVLRAYKVGVKISLSPADQQSLIFHEPEWGDREHIELMITMSAGGVTIIPSWQSAVLPRQGEMQPVFFQLTPMRSGRLQVFLSFSLAREMTLLEEYRIALDVVDMATESQEMATESQETEQR